MEYEVLKWYDINSKTEYAHFVRHFNMLPLDGTFEYDTAETKSTNKPSYFRGKKQMLKDNQYLRDWKNSNPYIRIRFIPPPD
jgi:hypothetical protein